MKKAGFFQIFFLIIIYLLFSKSEFAKEPEKLIIYDTVIVTSPIPAIYSSIHSDSTGKLFLYKNGQKIYACTKKPKYTLKSIKGNPSGQDSCISFDFNNPEFSGSICYGFIHPQDSKHPQPVYFYKRSVIENGTTTIKIKNVLGGKFDMIGWEETGKGTLGYRIINNKGLMIYDGIISFSGKGPFIIDTTIIEGPFVNNVSHQGAVISFKTNFITQTSVEIRNKKFLDHIPGTHHEISITGLEANTEYNYTVKFGNNSQTFSFNTVPLPGSRSSFKFAFASDSRSGQGGGERNLFGTNLYMMKKIMALSTQQDAVFLQFTGDLVTGYLTNKDEINLQYANWKRSIEPFAHYIPVYTTMGNHEALLFLFPVPGSDTILAIDKFPFETESSEAIFSENFVNPTNGPQSEDGAYYDPDLKNNDFPSYKENVYYYIYDNIAMVVLNSDYLYAPMIDKSNITNGNLHGYIMDKQLEWLRTTIKLLERDADIDHIFITTHTPLFPNGGHITDDMWYNGNNEMRPYIAGKPLNKGIIERRDELLELLVNQSSKVVAILTGDEHNYYRLKISPKMNLYPNDYQAKKINISRTIYQINNGAAGAPYYALEKAPWSDYVTGFTTQNAVVFFHIEGKKVRIEVINPDTLENIDTAILRK